MTPFGITGPHKDLTREQERFVADTVFVQLEEATEFWSGCAYYVDSIGVYAAVRARVPLIGLTVPRVQSPGHEPELLWSNAKELIDHAHSDGSSGTEWVVLPGPPGRNMPEGYKLRDALTVSKIKVLLSFPRTSVEEFKGSGTWMTIRLALKAGVEVRFFPLDGSPPWVKYPGGARLFS